MIRTDQVAILCDIGQSTTFADDKLAEVQKLVVEGYVSKSGDLYELTRKGEKVLEDRGAGLNES